MPILGIEGMSPDQVQFEIQRGAKLVCYQYCISILVMSFRRLSDAYFVRAGESRVSKGLPWILLSPVCGLVGNSVGTDFHGAIPGDELQGRERSDRRVQCPPHSARRGTAGDSQGLSRP
jgi:hypothetical protein